MPVGHDGETGRWAVQLDGVGDVSVRVRAANLIRVAMLMDDKCPDCRWERSGSQQTGMGRRRGRRRVTIAELQAIMPAGTQRDTVTTGEAQWANVGIEELRMRHFVRTPEYEGREVQYRGPSRQLDCAPCCMHRLNGFGSRPVTAGAVNRTPSTTAPLLNSRPRFAGCQRRKVRQ